MSNRLKLRQGKKARRCPKCHSHKMRTMQYPDAMLYICLSCSFPVREERASRTGGSLQQMKPPYKDGGW